jgi:hypothetical protein
MVLLHLVSLKSLWHYPLINGITEATTPRSHNDKIGKGVAKHQAVLSIDMEIWKELIEVFDIREPMIPHRKEEPPKQIGGRGWYA